MRVREESHGVGMMMGFANYGWKNIGDGQAGE
jgi:hypothetical protein